MASRTASAVGVDRTTLLAFSAVVVFGGLNALAVKVSNAELAPYWGATLRFGIGTLLLTGLALFRHPVMPRGRALVGTVLFGIFNYTVFFAFLYEALLSVPAGMAMVLLALAPLLTLLLAAALGQQQLRLGALAGALMAVAGIVVVFREGIGAGVPIGPALLILGGAGAIAVSSVIVKGFPRVDPVASNLVAMPVGGLGLLALSALRAESWTVPLGIDTWLALAYLAALGSVALFVLIVYVIGRWTAVASSYAVVLMPLVTIPVAAFVAREAVTPLFLVGAAIVLLAVFLGTRSRRSTRDAVDVPAEPTLVIPGCP